MGPSVEQYTMVYFEMAHLPGGAAQEGQALHASSSQCTTPYEHTLSSAVRDSLFFCFLRGMPPLLSISGPHKPQCNEF